MKVNSCVTALASSHNLSDAHEMNSDELKETMKESPRRYTNPFLSDEENDQLNLWNNREHEHEHSINEDNFTTNLEDENFEKAKELYIDKDVTEFISCFEESGFHVKDICVDNGLSHNKKIEIDNKHHDLSCDPDTDTNTVNVNEDKNDDIGEDSCKNSDLCSVTQDKPDTDFPIPKLSNEDMTEENFDTDISSQSSSQGKDVKEDATKESGNQEKVENVCEDDNGPPNCLSNDLKSFVESNIIQTTEKCGPENPECIHEDTQSAPNQDMAANQLQRGGGESSFSIADPVSGRMAYCGSISHRSDGSNTSVRSFAFPILQTEWNSSPVRMAKVDQTRSQKHRGWRQALMCCRF